MTSRALLSLGISTALCAGVFIACSSSSSSPGTGTSSTDSGTTTGNDGATSGSDAGAKDAGGDAGPACASCTAAKKNCNVYPSTASTCTYATGSGFCLTDLPECFDSTSGNCDEFQFSCRSNADCSGGTSACCALNIPVASCMGTIPESTLPVTQCAATCAGGSQTCAVDSDCASLGLRCVPMTATSGSGESLTIGLCGS